MIGKLTGILDAVDEDSCVIDVHGVGYVAFCPAAHAGRRCRRPATAVTLFIDTYVREDMLRLYGFQTRSSASGSACCRAFRASAPRWRWRCCRPCRRPNSPMPSRCATSPRCRALRASARRWPSASSPSSRPRRRRSPGRPPGTIGLKQELGDGIAPAPIADAVSALVNLGYPRDTAANAVAAALKSAGEAADSRQADPAGAEGAGAVRPRADPMPASRPHEPLARA